ncbi:cysteine desulfurase family protein [Winogradskyella sediminis]|uniref:cysteine desulfurase family protein n=1 Tax=Winogradskyella sediminis TaxID=1382466 RepID=UPI003AA9B457
MKINGIKSYLDSASTTKIDKTVFKTMLPYFEEYYGNASSKHDFGEKSKQAIENSRLQVSRIINSNKEDIIFTSGSTESINYAIKGFLEANYDKGNHIITVKTEHKAVLSTCNYLETKGYEVTYLNVDKNGRILIEELRKSVKITTVLIVIMYVNNETGVIHPIKEIGAIAKEKNVTFFCDATQAIGKIPVNIENDNIDMLCFSGHKINGPKGIGVLYKKHNIELTPLIHGGSQENGNRSGTYNTPLIVGLGQACEIALRDLDKNTKKIETLKRHLFKKLNSTTSVIRIPTEGSVVPHISYIKIPELESNIFIDKYKDVALSSGSACNSEVMEVSHVIKAMFPNDTYESNYLRISLDKYSTIDDIDFFIESLNKYLNLYHA